MSEQVPIAPVQFTTDQLGNFVAYQGPAPLATNIYLSVMSDLARLSFVEFPPASVPGAPQFRAAVTLSLENLIALRDMLNRMLGNGQKEDMN